MGQLGIQKFKETHKCNAVCEFIGLKPFVEAKGRERRGKTVIRVESRWMRLVIAMIAALFCIGAFITLTSNEALLFVGVAVAILFAAGRCCGKIGDKLFYLCFVACIAVCLSR